MRPLAALTALLACAAIPATLGCGADSGDTRSDEREMSMSGAPSEPILTGTQPLLNGEPQNLSAYRGDVVMVVNTASECGYTPQFTQLEELYAERRDEGFVILGFPADDVAGQEPRSDEEIAEFCEANFGVSFPMFAKSNVTGEEASPLFQALAAEAGEPTWNFNKYLLDRKGNVVTRYEATDAPGDPAVLERVDELLDAS